MINKKSQLTFTTIFLISAFIILIFGMIQLLGQDVIDNENLNNNSKDYVNRLTGEFNEYYGTDKLAETETVVSTNTSGEGLGEFEIQYKETKASAEKKVDIIKIVQRSPDTVLLLFDLEKDDYNFFYNWAIAFLVVGLLIITFILLFGSGRM